MSTNTFNTSQSISPLTIIGNGAIGDVLHFYAQQSGVFPSISRLVRHSYFAAASQSPDKGIDTTQGNYRTLIDTAMQSHTLHAQYLSIGELSHFNWHACHWLLIPVKCYQVEDLLHALAKVIPLHTVLVFLHNGMGSVELCEQIMPQQARLFASITDGAYKSSPRICHQTGLGHLKIGMCGGPSLSPAQQKQLVDLHPRMQWQADMRTALLEKLAINAVINPLTAVLDIRNGELLEHKARCEAVIEELSSLYQAMNVPLSKTHLHNTIFSVISATANNYSSMHQDIKHKRQTEIQGILGYLITKAKLYSISIPLITTYYKQVIVLSKP